MSSREQHVKLVYAIMNLHSVNTRSCLSIHAATFAGDRARHGAAGEARDSLALPVRYFGRHIGWLLILGLFWLAPVTPEARGESLINTEPYDTIVLKQGAPMKVLPIKIQIPRNPSGDFMIPCRLESNPGERLEVRWSGVERVILFQDRLLAEARTLTKQKKFDQAFSTLKYIHDNYPDTTGLDSTVDQLLYSEALTLYRAGELERATLLLDEVLQRSPSRSRVATALTTVLNTRFKRLLQARDYQSARRLFENVEPKYKRSMPELVESWRSSLEAIGQRVLAQGNEYLEAGRYRDAYLASRRLSEIWPQTVGAETLLAKATQQYPLVRVAVLDATQVTAEASPEYSWVQRRRHRLKIRDLFELTNVGPEGAEYECTIGNSEIAPDKRSISIAVDPNLESGLTGVQLSQIMLDRSDLDLPSGDPAWASLAERIGAENVVDASAVLRRPFLRTESLLDISFARLNSDRIRTRFVPYQVTEEDAEQSRFVVNADYVFATATQPREVIEMRFDSPLSALHALRRREVDMIDRVFPADISQLTRDENIKLVRYRIPSLHVLVPNVNHDYLDNRLFRRGIAYSIDRAKILKRDLLGGADITGCQLISGPFSPGITSDDPLAYGYDRKIDPRPYDPRHAKTLIKLAQVEMSMVAEKNKEQVPELRELVIVYPAGEIARIACTEIVEDLGLIGIAARLETLPAGAIRPENDDWDLLYLDYRMPEPLVGARELLAYEGFASCRSPHLNLALRQLQQVVSWKDAGDRLSVIHQLCYDNTSVIPLWQLADHLAYRDGLHGISREPIDVYQDIEKWTLQ